MGPVSFPLTLDKMVIELLINDSSFGIGMVISIPLFVLLKNGGITMPAVAETLLIIIEISLLITKVTELPSVTSLTGSPVIPENPM